MRIPAFVEYSVMSSLVDTTLQINVTNILVSSSVPQKYTGEVMPIQLSTAFASSLDTHSRSKQFKVTEIRLASIPSFKWSALYCAMDTTIVQINCVDECSGPILGRQ